MSGAVEGTDVRGTRHGEVCDRAVLVNVELQDDAASERHRRRGHEPVPADLRHETAQPRTELDAFGIELNRRAGIRRAALRVLESLVLDVAFEIAERFAECAGRRT